MNSKKRQDYIVLSKLKALSCPCCMRSHLFRKVMFEGPPPCIPHTPSPVTFQPARCILKLVFRSPPVGSNHCRPRVPWASLLFLLSIVASCLFTALRWLLRTFHMELGWCIGGRQVESSAVRSRGREVKWAWADGHLERERERSSLSARYCRWHVCVYVSMRVCVCVCVRARV